MRNRYYSPNQNVLNSPSNNPQIQNSTTNKPMFPAVKSKQTLPTNRLIKSKSVLLCQSQKKIGTYTYDISKQIGSGYSSTVYKGMSIKGKHECAVKVIDLAKYNEASLKLLEDQTRILKTLDHPNVIKCLDVYKTSSNCYIVTEYCSQGDLLTFMDKQGKIQQSVSVKIMCDIIEGMKYLLEKGILHRDLKPANILNSKNCWKIADFGFAIYNQGKIKTRYNVGTPLYMPPEALLDNLYSPASDIFSVGIIFYELLTGVTPWECKSQKDLIKKMKSQPYCLPDKFIVSKYTRKIIEQLCEVDSSKRMSKEDFMKISFPKEAVRLELKKAKTVRTKTQTERQIIIKKKSLLNIKCMENKEDLSDTRIQTRNNHILINQLHYCRNIMYLKVGNKNKIKISLILYKHLLKLIKLLTDDKNNYFKLDNWERFRKSKKFYTTQLTMKEYLNRYQKQYMKYLREIDLTIINQINKDFPELSLQEVFTTKFYENLINFIRPLIREANHNITVVTQNQFEPLSTDIQAAIQALKSLLKYLKLVQISSKNFQNFQHFQEQSNIKVQIDYINSHITLRQYLFLRQQLKFY